MDYRERSITETIKKMLESQYEILDSHKATLRKLKVGKLIVRNRGGRIYYSELIDNMELGITKDVVRRHKVIHAHFLRCEIYNLEKRIEILESALNSFDKRKVKNINSYIRKEDVVRSRYPYDAWQWMKGEYDINSFHSEALQYETILGTLVRSKSELNIANALERMGIPYRYEQKIYLDSGYQYPDFTILKLDKSILIWEHNGLMDDLEYAEKAMLRTRRYEESGYRQHRDLIITYEDDIRTPQQIENIIKRYIFF